MNCWTLTSAVLFHYVLLSRCIVQSQLDQVSTDNTDCTCPGEVLSFECNASGGFSTVWRVSLPGCSSDGITLLHTGYNMGVNDSCSNGLVNVMSLMSNGNFTSRLNVQIPDNVSLAMLSVNCSVDTQNGEVIVGSRNVNLIQGNFEFPKGDVQVYRNITKSETDICTFEWTFDCLITSNNISESNCFNCSLFGNSATCYVQNGMNCSLELHPFACSGTIPGKSITAFCYPEETSKVADITTVAVSADNTTVAVSDNITTIVVPVVVGFITLILIILVIVIIWRCCFPMNNSKQIFSKGNDETKSAKELQVITHDNPHGNNEDKDGERECDFRFTSPGKDEDTLQSGLVDFINETVDKAVNKAVNKTGNITVQDEVRSLSDKIDKIKKETSAAIQCLKKDYNQLKQTLASKEREIEDLKQENEKVKQEKEKVIEEMKKLEQRIQKYEERDTQIHYLVNILSKIVEEISKKDITNEQQLDLQLKEVKNQISALAPLHVAGGFQILDEINVDITHGNKSARVVLS